MEVDVKEADPKKFYAIILTTMIGLTSGTGFVSYTSAAEATRNIAEEAAQKSVDVFRKEVKQDLEALEKKVDETHDATIEAKTDIKWIRQALERFEEDRR